MVHGVIRVRHHPPAAAVGPPGERGVVLVVSALLMVSLVAITALVVDIGYAKSYRRQAQATADAAALAAVQDLDGSSAALTTAVATAKSYAAKNSSAIPATSWAGCTDGEHLTVTPDPVPVVNQQPTTFTASWSGLDPASTYLGLLTYEGALKPTVVKVTTP